MIARWTLLLITGITALVSPALAQMPKGFTMPAPSVLAPEDGGRRITADGLVANYYPGSKMAGPAILLLGGSEGGIGGGAARQAHALVAHGFVVLQLAYFGAPGLPATLNLVPLEYFQRALAWLRHQPEVDGRSIGIIGASKGAEAALLVASRDPAVRAVVAGVPSSAVWPGIDFSGGHVSSSWSEKGKPLAYLDYGGTPGASMRAAYAAGLTTLAEHPKAAIPVEYIHASVLLVCGRDDQLWPSCPMSEMIAARIHAKGRSVSALEHDDAGHAAFGPPVDPATPAYASLGSLGGSPAGNNAARTADWPTILAFLDKALGN